QRERLRAKNPGGEPGPARTSDRCSRGGHEGGREHLAFQADIDQPAALAEQTAQRAQDERRRDAQRGREDEHRDGDPIFHQVSAALTNAGFSRPSGANRVSNHGRVRFASAPENRITKPWITTTMSRVTSGISNASSAPPW